MFFTAETQPKQMQLVPEPPPVHALLPMTPPMMTAGSLRPQGRFFSHIILFFWLITCFLQQKHNQNGYDRCQNHHPSLRGCQQHHRQRQGAFTTPRYVFNIYIFIFWLITWFFQPKYNWNNYGRCQNHHPSSRGCQWHHRRWCGGLYGPNVSF